MKTKVPQRFASRFLLAGIFVTGAGCVRVYTSTGQSSGKMKHNLERSWLFKSSDILYPPGTQNVAEYPHLNKDSVGYLQTGLQGMLKAILDQHARNFATGGKHFETEFPKAVKANVLVDNLELPIAQSFPNEQGNLEIRVDVRVLQATFRGSLVAALRGSDEFEFSSKKSTAQSDDEILSDFLKYKDQVTKAKAGNTLGDVFGALRSKDDDFDNARWFQMVDLAEKGDEIQSRYTGTLMFLLAHEVGHFVLKHHQVACDSTQCDRFAERELQADRYGGFVLGTLLAPFSATFEGGVGILGGMDEVFPISHYAGFDVFFNDAYQRIGFVDSKASACSCAYPEPKQRQAAALAGKQRATSEYIALLAKDPEAAKRTTPLVLKPRKH